MKNEDFKRFSVSWQTAQAAYGKPVEPAVVALVFRVLEPYALADVEAALGAHLRDPETGQFPPKPADVVRKIEGSSDAQVALAWATFRECTRSGEMPADETLATVIRRMGGLERLGDMKSRDLDFLHKNFAALYLATKEPMRAGIAGPVRTEAVLSLGAALKDRAA